MRHNFFLYETYYLVMKIKYAVSTRLELDNKKTISIVGLTFKGILAMSVACFNLFLAVFLINNSFWREQNTKLQIVSFLTEFRQIKIIYGIVVFSFFATIFFSVIGFYLCLLFLWSRVTYSN